MGVDGEARRRQGGMTHEAAGSSLGALGGAASRLAAGRARAARRAAFAGSDVILAAFDCANADQGIEIRLAMHWVGSKAATFISTTILPPAPGIAPISRLPQNRRCRRRKSILGRRHGRSHGRGGGKRTQWIPTVFVGHHADPREGRRRCRQPQQTRRQSHRFMRISSLAIGRQMAANAQGGLRRHVDARRSASQARWTEANHDNGRELGPVFRRGSFGMQRTQRRRDRTRPRLGRRPTEHRFDHDARSYSHYFRPVGHRLGRDQSRSSDLPVPKSRRRRRPDAATASTLPTRSGARPFTSIASSRAKSRRTCRFRRRTNSRWSSISEPRRRSV